MVILDLWGMGFHAMVVIASIYILLLESIWAYCGHLEIQPTIPVSYTHLTLPTKA